LELKKRRAREIAGKLCDIRLWNSHGIGINLERLRSVCNLQINDFGQAPELRQAVRSYHKLLSDYMRKLTLSSVLHTRQTFGSLSFRNQERDLC